MKEAIGSTVQDMLNSDLKTSFSKKDFDVDKLKDHFTLFHKGERFTIDQLLSGNLAGRMIALGDTIDILIKIDQNGLEKFSEGTHTFKFKSEIIPTFEFNFELGKENLNQNFDSVNN